MDFPNQSVHLETNCDDDNHSNKLQMEKAQITTSLPSSMSVQCLW